MNSTELLTSGETRTWRFPDPQSITIVCEQPPQLDSSYVDLLAYGDLDALVDLHGHIRLVSQLKEVRTGVTDVTRMCSDLIHELAHGEFQPPNKLVTVQTNFRGASYELLKISLPAGSEGLHGEWETPPPLDDLASSEFLGAISVRDKAADQVGVASRRTLPLTQSFSETLLRFVSHVLTAIRLMLVRVLAALTQVADAITFALTMIAACQRYGRRDGSDDHHFLLTRQYRMSPGRVPTV